MQEIISVIKLALTISAFVSGLIAAVRWYQSSSANNYPDWTWNNPEPVDSELRQLELNVAMLTGMQRAASLNKAAAFWTALSIAIGTAANVISVLT